MTPVVQFVLDKGVLGGVKKRGHTVLTVKSHNVTELSDNITGHSEGSALATASGCRGWHPHKLWLKQGHAKPQACWSDHRTPGALVRPPDN